ncbi:ABC transporter permease [Salinigranum marinum]|uniref:ABC transporter permease n=1 Tax=Salinigranum marinum TaxID=1515595 RepID=UPI002989CFC8|nr:ABC transporter permease [Salinigranum marinum]
MSRDGPSWRAPSGPDRPEDAPGATLVDRFPVLALAARNLTRTKTRSVLAALGIAIGVIAIASLGMFGSAFQRSQMENIGQIGNDVAVAPGEDLGRDNFTETQLREIQRAAGGTELVAVKRDSREVTFRGETQNRTVYGLADPNSLYDVRQGFIPDQWRDGAVVGSQLAADEGIRAGEALTVDGQTFRVVAVLDETGQAVIVNPDNAVLLPPDRFDENTYAQVVVLSESTAEANRTAMDIRTAMNGRQQRVQIFEFGQLADQINQLFFQLNLFLVGIGAVSLVVAGTSILNVMLMSTVERREEIGVLRAVGFEKRAVLRILLTEAGILGLAGGTVGVVVSFLIGAGVNSLFLGDPLAFDTLSVFYLAAGFAFGVGSSLLSGAYPAWKAATLDPVQALRGS